jgi:hypothetical protein
MSLTRSFAKNKELAIIIILVDIERRDRLLKTVAQAERDYAEGNVRRGSVSDLMLELDN